MRFSARYRPLFLTALVACTAVVGINAGRWLAGGSLDDVAVTAAGFMGALFGYCLHLARGEASANG